MNQTAPVWVNHPLVDGAGPGWVATETRADVVALTAGMSDFLSRVTAGGDRAIVVTSEFSRVTQPLSQILSDIGGHWLVRTDAGFFDTRTGVTLANPADALELPKPSADNIAPQFLRAAIATRLQAAFTISTRLRLGKAVRLGGALEAASVELTGEPPSAWGATEPLVARWNRDELTEYSRRRMPNDSRWAAVGTPSAPLVATLQVARTKEGLEETTRLWADVGAAGAERGANLAGEARRVLTLAANHGMPLLGVAFAHIGAPDLTRRALIAPPPQPLALLIGPPGVRLLGLDVHRWTDRFDADLLGSPRLPGVLVPLGGVDGGGWERLGEVLGSLDARTLAAALSLAPHVAAQLTKSAGEDPHG